MGNPAPFWVAVPSIRSGFDRMRPWLFNDVHSSSQYSLNILPVGDLMILMCSALKRRGRIPTRAHIPIRSSGFPIFVYPRYPFHRATYLFYCHRLLLLHPPKTFFALQRHLPSIARSRPNSAVATLLTPLRSPSSPYIRTSVSYMGPLCLSGTCAQNQVIPDGFAHSPFLNFRDRIATLEILSIYISDSL